MNMRRSKCYCPKCGERLSQHSKTTNKNWDSTLPMHYLQCENCDYISPVACSDSGEVDVVFLDFVMGQKNEYSTHCMDDQVLVLKNQE